MASPSTCATARVGATATAISPDRLHHDYTAHDVLHASPHVRFSLPDAYHVSMLDTTPAHTLDGSRSVQTPPDRAARYQLIPIPLRPRRPAPHRSHVVPARFPRLANADTHPRGLPVCVPPVRRLGVARSLSWSIAVHDAARRAMEKNN
ncbi:hypothetical protein B0H13DRAFT_2319245 [Mycena leptocephala]|nr:hypothetical protein B0H13DRAFT_2319245 [Mycena leptocephala]